MSFPFVEAFLALLAAYMGYSVWAGLDPRYPIGAALVLLVATAAVDALGSTAAANTLAEYVFFLLGAGVLLLLVDHVRESRDHSASAGSLATLPQGKPAQSAEQGQGTTDHPLDRFQEQTVPIVDAPGREHEHDEQSRDAQT